MSPNERAERWLEDRIGGRAFLTPSCTAALEMAASLSINPGDEVVMPSFGFSSCANAVIRAGGTPVFVDIRPDTLNMDESLARSAWDVKTSAFMPIHYGSVKAVTDYSRTVIEDAAHCIGDLKVSGTFACLSFHSTKNISCGEGGALIVNDEALVERVQVLRHCGTTKAIVHNAWDWVDTGSAYLMSPELAEILLARLQSVDEITEQRREIWHVYHDSIEAEYRAEHPGNGHIFWFLSESRDDIARNLQERGIRLTSHYTPLHNRKPGLRYGRAHGHCPVSVRVSSQILRTPMNVTPSEAKRISQEINKEMA